MRYLVIGAYKAWSGYDQTQEALIEALTEEDAIASFKRDMPSADVQDWYGIVAVANTAHYYSVEYQRRVPDCAVVSGVTDTDALEDFMDQHADEIARGELCLESIRLKQLPD